MPTVNGDVTVNDVTVNVDMEVEVFCASCGAGLCNQSTSGKTRNRQSSYIEVEACKKCLDNARDEGFQSGYDEGAKDKEKELEKDKEKI